MHEYYERKGIAAKGRLNVMVNGVILVMSLYFRMKIAQNGDGIHYYNNYNYY